MISKSFLAVLLFLALLLPVVAVVVFALGQLLGAMQDTAGQTVLIRTAQGCVIAWSVDLVVLLICLAVHNIGTGDPPQEPRP